MVCKHQHRRFSVATASATPVTQHRPLVPPVNVSGGQCSWCGKYGHQRGSCPFL
ncbi:hypothetical protein BCR43DRAFT_497743, partial [Syncephalastrum racemosum]